jgi:hypothetical protein
MILELGIALRSSTRVTDKPEVLTMNRKFEISLTPSNMESFHEHIRDLLAPYQPGDSRLVSRNPTSLSNDSSQYITY